MYPLNKKLTKQGCKFGLWIYKKNEVSSRLKTGDELM